jgi:hypothetical protein
MKKIVALMLVLALIFPLTACFSDRAESINAVPSSQPANESESGFGTAAYAKQNPDVTSSTISVAYDSYDDDSSWKNSEMSYITLKGNSITIDGGGGVVDGSKIAITSAGTYGISGVLDDGQIIVKTEDKQIVKLILFGVDITCSTSAPIYVYKAKKTVITLADGTKNYVTDGASYVFADSTSDEPNAAVFSKDDLTINGNGSLTVNANYNNGITSKDELKITGGNIVVNAVNDGIRGRDFIAVKDGAITVNAASDGMQSNNDEDSEKGFVYIEDGTLNITAGEDGIQAETRVVINGGNIAISSGGGSVNSSIKIGDRGNPWDNQSVGNTPDSNSSSGSAKGLKAGVDITIEGGNINIDSSDDSIHSNDSLTISGGNIILASGDDGMHSDVSLEISGGDISIMECYEGIDSAAITINDGNIHLVASDDGINAVSGNDGFPMMGQPGQNNFNFAGDNGTNVVGGNDGFPMMRQPGRNKFNFASDNGTNAVGGNGAPPMMGQPGQEGFNLYGNSHLDINGGYIVVDAKGDGLDINGAINMTAGVVIVNGPTANDNGALDYLGDFKITGGFLVAVGSSGMAQAPSTSSTQYSVMLNLSSSQSANTMIHIETNDGEGVLTFVPTKAYQSLVLCSPELKNGSTYIVYSGGSSTGTVTDGLYSGGIYAPGTQITSFTISSIVTTIGSSMGGFPGGGGGNMVPGGMRR